jgi:hypothetical protein
MPGAARRSAMRYALLIVPCAVLFALSQGSVDKPEPRAVLSWDPEEIVENLEVAPEDTVFLYIMLIDVPDIKTISFETVWNPWNDPFGCYRMIPGDPSDSYGWIDGDCVEIVDDENPCTSTLHFKEPPKNGSYIRLAFAPSGLRKKLRGTFCLREFLITDTSGAESYLLTPNIATILGGVRLQLPQYACRIEPAAVTAGSETQLRVHGGYFLSPMKVFLFNIDSKRTIPLPFDLISESLISCRVSPAHADTGRWALVTRNGEGFEHRCPSDLVVGAAPATVAVESPGAGPLSLNCYPSLFRGSTELCFNLAKSAHAKVTVFDAAGRRVSVPFDGQGERGDNSVRWDGRTSGGAPAPPGVYFVTVESSGKRESKKIILVK